MQDDGRTLPDGNHELIVHKVPWECLKEYPVFFKDEYITYSICSVYVILTFCIIYNAGLGAVVGMRKNRFTVSMMR